MARQLPLLREISLSDLLNRAPPSPRIKTEEDVGYWKTTRSYGDLGLFLQRLNEAVVGCCLPFVPQSPSKVNYSTSATCKVPTDPDFQRVSAILAVLDELDAWIEETPPLQTPQRFGNIAFRTWGKRLEDVRLRRLL